MMLWSIPSRFIRNTILLIGPMFFLIGCASKSPDPRTEIEAEGVHLEWISKEVNGSKLCQAYLEEMDPGRSKQLVYFSLTMERKKISSVGGDYDPGRVMVTFYVESLVRKSTLFEQAGEVDLAPFMIGVFDKNASREEIQEIAFKATEEKTKPYLGRWVDLACVKAMGLEPEHSAAFVPALEALVAEDWTSDDLRAEAREALSSIR